MPDSNKTPLYRQENNDKYMYFQVGTERNSELAESDLRLRMGKLAVYGERSHYPEQKALMQTAKYSHQLKHCSS
jgi:hypothetical protein